MGEKSNRTWFLPRNRSVHHNKELNMRDIVCQFLYFHITVIISTKSPFTVEEVKHGKPLVITPQLINNALSTPEQYIN